jgi:hypothetical protein
MEYARLKRERIKSERNIRKTRSERSSLTTAAHWPLGLNHAYSPALRLGDTPVRSHGSLSNGVQAKLTINDPGDQHEQEAHRVAEQVMRMPGPMLRLQRKCACGSTASGASCEKCQNQSVQLKRTTTPANAGSGGSAPSSVHDVLRSPGRPLEASAREFMEMRFSTDFSHVRVHSDAAAASSARQINALAYTAGHNVVFGAGQYSPHTDKGKALLAHELAHVVQQGSPGAGHPTVQRFTDYTALEQGMNSSLGWTHPSSKALKVADDGQLAVEDLGWGQSRLLWAESARISSANSILKAQGSKVELKTRAGNISGTPPGIPIGKTVKLTEIEPVDRASGTSLTLIAGCSNACRQVMGIADTETTVAVMKAGKNEEFTKAYGSFAGYGGAPNTTAPEKWSEEIFKKEFGAGLTRTEALKKYSDLTATKKEAFDKKYGINKYAVPTVGQGITAGTEFNMPGFKKHQVPGPGGTMVDRNTWNFHFSTAILTSGKDYITIENATGSTDPFWVWMYGPASKKQSFDEFQAATLGHGTRQTSMVVEPEKLILGEINAADSPLLDDAGKITKLATGITIRVIQRPFVRNADTFWRVKVTSGASSGLEGQIRGRFLKLIKP